LVLDVSEEEADKILLTLDPLAALAGVDEMQLADLLSTTKFESPQLEQMLDGLARETAGAEEALATAATERPEIEIPESYQVVVECESEADQEAVFTRMREEGYRCRVLTL